MDQSARVGTARDLVRPELKFEGLRQSAGACAFADAVIRLARARSNAAFILTTQCDQLRRGFDIIEGNAPESRLFLFNLPATCQTPAAAKLFASELARLGKFLVALGGHAPGDQELRLVMAQYSANRSRLAEAGLQRPARLYAEAIGKFFWDGSVALPSGAEPAGDHHVPTALIGGPLLLHQRQLLDVLERAGARVVLNATEPGERNLWPSIASETCAGEATPPLELLARVYTENCADMYQRPNTRLYSWIETRLRSRGVRGIIVWHHVGCDLWRAEAQSLRETFGLPVLLLDADELESGSPRSSTRLEAFVEALR